MQAISTNIHFSTTTHVHAKLMPSLPESNGDRQAFAYIVIGDGPSTATLFSQTGKVQEFIDNLTQAIQQLQEELDTWNSNA